MPPMHLQDAIHVVLVLYHTATGQHKERLPAIIPGSVWPGHRRGALQRMQCHQLRAQDAAGCISQHCLVSGWCECLPAVCHTCSLCICLPCRHRHRGCACTSVGLICCSHHECFVPSSTGSTVPQTYWSRCLDVCRCQVCSITWMCGPGPSAPCALAAPHLHTKRMTSASRSGAWSRWVQSQKRNR